MIFGQFSGTKIDLDGIIVFNYNEDLYKQHMSSPQAIVDSLTNTDLLKNVELTVRTWSKQMERVRSTELKLLFRLRTDCFACRRWYSINNYAEKMNL